MNWILAGITFGFLGSFHCIGMCGPLALALPGSAGHAHYYAAKRTVYNLGRVTTYSLMGAVVGLLSQTISVGGYQQALSIAVGLLFLLGVTVSPVQKKLNHWKGLPGKLLARATRPIKALFQNDRWMNLYLIGVLNGFLPCGFVYMALAASLTSGSVYGSIYFMMGFGFGT
ncbi:MAG: sulfite exporter TauE/SafE family protein, partial [Balneolaceae bacterium]|nr:sulfite exporter TauE/SafE family protein [Balneolaceae bacterium]